MGFVGIAGFVHYSGLCLIQISVKGRAQTLASGLPRRYQIAAIFLRVVRSCIGH